MYGNPNAKTPFPPLNETTPYLVRIDGRAWLSSLGLAAVMGQPHTAVAAAIESLDIGPLFRAENFRPSRTPSGARAPGLWISAQGFELLSLTFPRDRQAYWRATLREAFRAINAAGTVEIDAAAEPIQAPPPGRNWLSRLLGRVAA
jgi:hypothetical protein